MTRQVLVQIPLEKSWLCVQLGCDTISNDSSKCPRCGSAVLSLASVLGERKEQEAVCESELQS